MKLFYIILALVVVGCLYLLGQQNKQVYEDCVAAGVQSDETCYEIAYL